MSQETSVKHLTRRFKALQRIAVELINASNDHDLLTYIVDRATDLIGCDGGSLYLRQDEKYLVFEVALNRSVSFDFEKFVIPTTARGIAAHVFRSCKALRIPDVYDLGKNCPYEFNNTFDEKVKYRTKSVLAIPLVSSKGEKLGVLQLVNRKPGNETWPSGNKKALEKMPEFSEEDQELLESFSALAAATIEKSNLYKSIENLFKGFIRASVQVIEERDPATSGHSERVAILTTELARCVSTSKDTALKSINFTSRQIDELYYASIVHDFGKVSVPEKVLLKADKLFDTERFNIRHRFDKFAHAAETRILRDFVEKLMREGKSPSEIDFARINKEIKVELAKIEEYWETILELNRPTVLDEDKSERLQHLVTLELSMPDGVPHSLLTPSEIESLKIKRGSLTERERVEIQHHVTSTYLFLKEIPWTDEYANVPEIAYAHHEKLDGSGYPRKLKAIDIPAQTRLMTICDIFDALVAADRPYKKALPTERALAILDMETNEGKLDKRFLKVFKEAKVYENVTFMRLNRSRRAA